MDTDDRSRWLIAFIWHFSEAKNPVWSVMFAFAQMNEKCSLVPIGYHPGRWSDNPITETEAIAIIDEAADFGPIRNADKLAKYLGLTYQQRTQLEIRTIGACDFPKRERTKQRKHKAKMRKQRARLAAGRRPQSQSLSATRPWGELGMSRATWYRRNKPGMRRETVLSAISSFSPKDESVSVERLRPFGAPPKAARRQPRKALPSNKQVRGQPSSQTATKLAADVFGSLPVEL